MPNERLRSSITSRGLSLGALAEAVQVDAKTVERWISLDRVPRGKHRFKVAALLAVDEAHLWPSILKHAQTRAATEAEFVAIYSNRGEVPHDVWHQLIDSATDRIEILAYAALFLTDWDPDLDGVLAAKARAGTTIRLLLGDPASPAVAARGAEEGINAGLAARILISEQNLARTIGTDGVELRHHSTTLYNSIYRFDENVLVNTHAYGFQAAQSPVLHFHRVPGGRLFEHYLSSFKRVWDTTEPQEENR